MLIDRLVEKPSNILKKARNKFVENAIWIQPKSSNEPIPDERDRVFYDIARACKARLVTGNIKQE